MKGTIEAYVRTVHQVMTWVAARPGNGGSFQHILRSLVEQEGDRRGAALFALGYWAGCRVSDVSWLQMAHTHVGPKVGWLHVGYKAGKWRDIDLMNEARKPLYEYLQATRDTERVYVFTSQQRWNVCVRRCMPCFHSLRFLISCWQG